MSNPEWLNAVAEAAGEIGAAKDAMDPDDSRDHERSWVDLNEAASALDRVLKRHDWRDEG